MNNPLQQQIEALLPEEMKEMLCPCKRHQDMAEAYNESLSLCKQSLSKIIELIEKETREKCKKIVTDETPQHFTREYRETDSMRDRIINLINKE